jgi:hypothetical protein
MSIAGRAALLLALSAVLLLMRWGGGDAAPSETEAVASTSVPAEDAGVPAGGPPEGEAVTVAAGYQPPTDHVPSTGAYVPANGKPTLVFVDAIW